MRHRLAAAATEWLGGRAPTAIPTAWRQARSAPALEATSVRPAFGDTLQRRLDPPPESGGHDTPAAGADARLATPNGRCAGTTRSVAARGAAADSAMLALKLGSYVDRRRGGHFRVGDGVAGGGDAA